MKIQSGLQMTQKLINFLNDAKNKAFATDTGTKMHTILQHVIVDDKFGCCGDVNIIKIIKNRPDLAPFFTAKAKTEVAIAGKLRGRFISRRIDRLVINNDTKTICFIDYKTDTDKTLFIDKYKLQLQEYAQLLKSAYSGYKISGYILWTCDWQFEKIIG